MNLFYRMHATEILKVAEEVREALSNSSLAQEHAGVAIINAKGDIDEVNSLLDKVKYTYRIIISLIVLLLSRLEILQVMLK